MADMPTVLVVEDEPFVQHTLCTALTLMGYKTYRAETFDTAVAILGSQPIHAVSLDIRIPDQAGLQRSGLSLLAHLRSTEAYASIPVLIFTGMPLSPEDEEIVRRHRARVFYKPERYSFVIEELRVLLQKASAA